jgi:hypothetical protein
MICCLSVPGKYDILLTIKRIAWRHVFLMSLSLFKSARGGCVKERAQTGVHTTSEKNLSLHNTSIHLTLAIYSNLRNGMTVKKHEKAEEKEECG